MIENGRINLDAFAPGFLDQREPPAMGDATGAPLAARVVEDTPFCRLRFNEAPLLVYSDHGTMIGHIVHAVKAIVSGDNSSGSAMLRGMPKADPTPREFRLRMCARLQAARENANYTQKEFAQKLGLDQSTYAKYETRSALPHHLIPKVCDLLGMDCWFLLTGQFRQPDPRKTGPLDHDPPLQSFG